MIAKWVTKKHKPRQPFFFRVRQHQARLQERRNSRVMKTGDLNRNTGSMSLSNRGNDPAIMNMVKISRMIIPNIKSHLNYGKILICHYNLDTAIVDINKP